MFTKVQRWGNSLAVRTPKAFAVDARLENDAPVEINLDEGKIVITPVSTRGWTLDELLEGIKEDNLHQEIDIGQSA
jgi:antitoxin MazE